MTEAAIQEHEDVRWHAILSRDGGASNDFLYAVQTTGVVCRPGCKSRLPRRENVEFFDSLTAALAAGYRPCKRCRPDVTDADKVTEACRMLTAAQATVRTRDVAAALGLSPGYFQRLFKAQLGVTPQQYRRRLLAERARDTIAEAGSIAALAYDAGYVSSSRFYAGVGRELGMSPRVAKRGGSGERVAYAVTTCSLGHILVAWTERGVCQVDLADSPETLATRLAQRFPKAHRDAAEVGAYMQAVIRTVDQKGAQHIPLELRGTAFQERVWQELRRIPAGQTRTYTEIARAIGRPRAARAVAGACAANNLAVVVPCHRVVRTSGDLSGYRWGLDRKAELLRRESEVGDENP